jgi:hypothetical protein
MRIGLCGARAHSVVAPRRGLDGPHGRRPARIWRMGRYRHPVYAKATPPRWIVVFGQQWQRFESQRIEPGADLQAAIACLNSEGWRIEAEPRFSFAFIRRDGDRRLLMLTPRDAHYKPPAKRSPDG